MLEQDVVSAHALQCYVEHHTNATCIINALHTCSTCNQTLLYYELSLAARTVPSQLCLHDNAHTLWFMVCSHTGNKISNHFHLYRPLSNQHLRMNTRETRQLLEVVLRGAKKSWHLLELMRGGRCVNRFHLAPTHTPSPHTKRSSLI